MADVTEADVTEAEEEEEERVSTGGLGCETCAVVICSYSFSVTQ